MESKRWLLVLTAVVLAVLAVSAFCVALTYDGNTDTHKEVTLTVKEPNSVGHYKLNEKSDVLSDAGYAPGDIVNLKISGFDAVEAIYSDNHKGCFPLNYFIFTDEYGDLIAGIFNLCTKKHLSLNPGDTVRVSYCDHLDLKHIFKKYMRSDDRPATEYRSIDAYCNFRCPNTTGMLENKFFRSVGYTSPQMHARGEYINSLYENAGIKYELSLSSSEKEYDRYFAEHSGHEYLRGLYSNGRICAFTMGIEFYTQYGDYRKALLKVSEADGPMCIHCVFGKDRTGYLFAMMEAVAGATKDEIIDDFMQSYVDLYGIEKGTAEYNLIKDLHFDRTIYIMEDVNRLKDVSKIDWTLIDYDSMDYSKILRDYVHKHVLDDREYSALYKALTGKDL